MLADELGGSGRWYLVAEDNTSDQVGGYAGIWVNGEVGEVMTIGVDPINHRQGLGRALMQALIDHAIIVGAKELFLEVQVDNLPAVTLYKSLGFECLGIRKRYYQDKDAYTMRLQLV
jgi:ribosomal-protein-alanine N-acetyltransferase